MRILVNQIYSFIMTEQNDLFFIRHGESLKNSAAKKYQTDHGYEFDWDLFLQDPLFVRGVIYNPKLIDCHLSQKGRQQCLAAQQELKDFHPDIILVSPLQRALETASLIFEGKDVPRVVEPLLSETFRHSSEICRSIELKKKQFPLFDFSKVEAEGQFWFIKNDSLQNQERYFQFLKEVESEYYHQKANSISEFMHRQNMGEKAKNVRDRARKMKQILMEYRKTYPKIAIVSHFYTIRFLCCTDFTEEDQPKDKINMHNCGVLEKSLAEICQIN